MKLDDYFSIAGGHSTNPATNIKFDKGWTQGRTVFGGLSAATAYCVASSHIDKNYRLISMTTNFVAPIWPDVTCNFNVELIRAGKNVAQYQARILQDGKVALVCQLCFGRPRTSKIDIKSDSNHNWSLPEKPTFIPNIPRVTPKFFKHFDLSIESGGIPFTGRKTDFYEGWMRFKDTPTEFTKEHLITMIDSWPPAVLQLLKWPASASTVTWHLDFLEDSTFSKSQDWFAYKCYTKHASDGYVHTDANIFSSDGVLVAQSRQTICVFA